MKRLIFSFISLIVICTSSFSQIANEGNHGNWENIGPFGNPEVHWSATGNGALDFVEMHPTNPAIMYVAARNGGLWRTTNYGANWTPITDYFKSPHCSSVEVCKADPNIMYMAAKGDNKIWYSDNSGSTWKNRSTGLQQNDQAFDEVHSDPQNADRVLVATTSGIYLSTNAGISWSKKVSGSYSEIDADNEWDLLIVSRNNTLGNPEIQYSTDKGDTWSDFTVATTSSALQGKAYVAMYEENNAITVFVYAVKNGNSPTNFIGLWKSEYSTTGTPFAFTRIEHDSYSYPNGPAPLVVSGSSFKEGEDNYGGINPYGSSTWVSDFFVDPKNPDNMLTCREKLWGTNNGGKIWEFKPSYGGSNWADNRYITTNITEDTVYWCNDGGLWAISTEDLFKDGNVNDKVVAKNGDICVTEGGQMDVSQQDKNVFITGGQDIGQIFVRNSRDSHVASADVYRGRIKPNDDSKFITGALNIQIDGNDYEVYNNIEADHHNPDRIYGFTNGTVKLVRSPAGSDGWDVQSFRGENHANAGGHSWTPVNNSWEEVKTGISNLRNGTFEQSRANAEIAFIGDENGRKLYITNDLSSSAMTWTQLTDAPALSLYRIATHPNDENLVAIATNNAVYISKNKGQSWTEKGSYSGTSPNRILFDKNTTEGMYIQTNKTVYYIDETLSDWIEFNKGLPDLTINEMRIAHYGDKDNFLYVNKYGRGVWRSPLFSTGNASPDPTIAKSGWSIHYTDIEDGSAAINAIDGDNSTIWHTGWDANLSYPHELQINLGDSYSLTELKYLPRQDSSAARIANYEFYVSKDGTNWGDVVATSSWADKEDEKYSSGIPIIRQADWTLLHTDSEETAAEDGAAINAFDGDQATIWHTEWSQSSPNYPHEIQINLGAEYSISELRYLPRQSNQNGRIRGYEIYIRNSGSTWGTAVASGNWPNSTAEQAVQFTAKSGRYIRLKAISEVNGNAFAAVSEISLYGIPEEEDQESKEEKKISFKAVTGQYIRLKALSELNDGSSAAAAEIDVCGIKAKAKPFAEFTADVTDLEDGGEVSFTDVSANKPSSWLWDFPGALPASSSNQNPVVNYNNSGEYQVSLTVSNTGGSNTKTKTNYITVNKYSSDVPMIFQSDWTLHHTDSEETAGEDGAAKNAFDGNPETIWHTEWSQSSPNYPHEIQVNLGALYSITELRYLPRQNSQNGRIKGYEIYVSEDSLTWGDAVASGNWLNTADEQAVKFSAKKGKYMRLKAISEVNGRVWATAAEITLYGTKEQTTFIGYDLESNDNDDKLLAYPNPAFGEINISIEDENTGELQIRLINFAGQTVFQKFENKYNNVFNSTISLSELPRDMYILNVILQGKKYSKKILLINPPEDESRKEGE